MSASICGQSRSFRLLRIWRELPQGIRAGKERVQQPMQQNGIRARGKRRFRVTTTDSRQDLPIASNLLNRNPNVAASNQAWVDYITYIVTDEVWLFLASVIDLFQRQVVNWSMRPDMQRDLVSTPWREMAWYQRRTDEEAELIFHSDRAADTSATTSTRCLRGAQSCRR